MLELLNWEELLQSTMVLFAVVDIVGSIPILVDVNRRPATFMRVGQRWWRWASCSLFCWWERASLGFLE